MIGPNLENTCVEDASVKMQRRSLLLAVKLNVIKGTAAGERQLDACKATHVAGSTGRSVSKKKESRNVER